MSKFKSQSSNEIQSSNDKRDALTFSYFDIPLAFACLPQAGVLTFGIAV
jgi:hypothetical protein